MLNNFSLRDVIKNLLIKKPELKEDDFRLLANLWLRQLKQTEKTEITAIEFLELLSKGEFTSPETVRRERQKLQEHNPELRGPNYQKRKLNSGKMKKALKSYHNPNRIPQ